MARSKRRRRGAPGKDRQDEKEQGREGSGEASDPRKGGAAAEWAKSLAVAAVIFIILRTFLVQTFVITSGSMEDTLLAGDFLVVNRVAIGSPIPFTPFRIPGYSKPRRFDVLVFDPPHEEDLKLVKRLVGMPGDTIEMRNRVVYLNGEMLDEPYVKHAEHPDESHPWMAWQGEYVAPGVDRTSYRPMRDNWGPLIIPDDRYLMLGDNREQSLDSRYWGLLEGWRLEGRAVFIYFSYNKASYGPLPFLTEVYWRRIGDLIR